jgi:phospholipid/cholesterol/gamma-HCH transport system permease protein
VTRILRSYILLLGELALFTGETFSKTGSLWRRRGVFLKQCEFFGVSALGVIVAAAVFVGAVLGYQLYISFQIFGAEALLGGTVGVTLFREMAPAMAAIMVTGRSGAAVAAQLASMRISEQIDALEVMAVDPFEYLMIPRVAAGMLMMPLLSVFFAGVASLSAEWVACGMMGLDHAIYWEQYSRWVDNVELLHVVAKGAAFGMVISLIACFCGYRASGGATGVGFATRTTVVSALLAVLFCDYLMTSLLPYRDSEFLL